jgi:hydrogenase maturation protease
MSNSSGDASHNHTGIIKVIGIGQSLRGDDAAGLAAVRLWQQTFQPTAKRPNIIVELAELPGIGLLSLLEGATTAILVDAVRSNTLSGTIHILTENQLVTFESEAKSAHGWGVAETLALGRKLTPSSMPKKLVLIGIETGQLDIGDGLSPEVEMALPEAANLIERYVGSELDQARVQSSSPRTSPK